MNKIYVDMFMLKRTIMIFNDNNTLLCNANNMHLLDFKKVLSSADKVRII